MIRIKFKSYFNIDMNNEFYEGYSDPNFRWNGWACPYFEKEVADYIASIVTDNETCILEYNEEQDKYFYTVMEGGEIIETDYFEKRIINTPEGIKEVYPIGSCNWIWDDYSLSEVNEIDDSIIITKEGLEKSKDDSMEIEY